MCHIFWLPGELQWSISKSVDSLLNQYSKDCFGKAAVPIKEMFLRWSTKYQGAADVYFSLKDLEKASSLITKESKEWIRIAYAKAYAHKGCYILNTTALSKIEINFSNIFIASIDKAFYSRCHGPH